MSSLKSTRSGGPAFFSKAVVASRRFFLGSSASPDSGLAVVCGGFERCSADYAIRRDTFPYFSIELVTQGEGRVVIDGVESSLSGGAIFSYGPGVRHEIDTTAHAPLEKYFVDFVGAEAEDLLANAGVAVGQYARVSPPGEVQLLFNELLRDGSRGHRLAREACAAILRCLGLRIATCLSAAGDRASQSHATFRECRDYIDGNVANLTTVGQVAKECGIAPSYLSRLFKKHGQGQSPYQYLLRARMNLAAEKLLNSPEKVQEVASDLGYSDAFHFSRAFKATFGVSPSRFRELR